MTSSGDHGGASEDELDSVLFAYSPRVINKFPSGTPAPFLHLLLFLTFFIISLSCVSIVQKNRFPKIPQIDFVPSFSLLLGIPIPYGNLGKIIPELFGVAHMADLLDYNTVRRQIEEKKVNTEDVQEAMWRLNSAMRVNVLQIRRYMETYLSLYSP